MHIFIHALVILSHIVDPFKIGSLGKSAVYLGDRNLTTRVPMHDSIAEWFMSYNWQHLHHFSICSSWSPAVMPLSAPFGHVYATMSADVLHIAILVTRRAVDEGHRRILHGECRWERIILSAQHNNYLRAVVWRSDDTWSPKHMFI